MDTRRISRRQLLAGLAAGAAGLVVVACTRVADSLTPRPSAILTPSVAPSPTLAESPEPPVPPLRVQIAQMLLVGFRGLTAAEAAPTLREIQDLGLGGVVIFDVDVPTGARVRNVESAAQLSELTAALQGASLSGPTAMPLVVAVDQEGGRVARLGERTGFPATESAASLGARDDGAATEAAGRAIAQTLASVGIGLNLAPVVDLNVNSTNPIIGALDRSFGADPALVTRQARAFIAGHHAVGLRCTLKHFPGHGSSTGDTHVGVVDVTNTWTEAELEPFAALVDDDEADAILTAHVFNARLDAQYPATLSHATVTGILREQLGYDGTVISDDLQMGAIRDAFGYDEAVALAIEAGVDILTIANQVVFEEGIVGRTIDIIAGHVAAGRVSEARIGESWRRIRALKATLG